MSFGFRTFGPTGALELDENSFTVGITYSEVVQSGGGQGRTRTISVPGVTAATHSAVCIPFSNYDTGAQFNSAIQYTPVVGNGVVTIYYGSPAANTGPIGTAPQRLLVMRYR